MKKPTFPRPRRYRSYKDKFGPNAEFFGSPEKREEPSLGSWPLVPLCALGALFLTIAIMCLAGLWKVSEVTAEDGKLYSAEVLLSHVHVEAGEKMVGFDTFAVERQLKEALPLLEKVQVRKHLNGKVSIRVTEETDLYYTCHNRNYYIIDAEDNRVICAMSAPDEAQRVGAVYIGFPENARVRVGEVLSFINLPYEPDSAAQEWTTYEVETDEPEIEYGYVDQFVEAIMDSVLADRVRGMELSDRYNISVVLKGNIKIRMGDTDELDRKFQMIDRVLTDKQAEVESADGMPILVDLSNPARIVFRMAPDVTLPDWGIEPESDPSEETLPDPSESAET